jgi:hypothetical protein
LDQWHTGVRILHHAHARAAVSFERRGRFLGVPVIILTTAVGTSIFAGAESSPTLKIIAGLLSLGAAVLSALQTTLKYSEVASQHKAAAQKYGKLRREIEVHEVSLQTETQASLTALLEKLQDEWDTLDDQSPTIPQGIYDKSAAIVRAGSSAPTTNLNSVATGSGE